MSEKGTGRPKATAILAGCASLVTIFTWIGITPAAVGQSVYDALCIAWPFLVAGLAFLAGWNLKKIWVSRELDKRAARIAKLEKSATDAAGRIAELENQARDRDSALESATRKNGAIERELVLFKVNAAPERRSEIIEIANIFRAKIVDVGKSSLTIEATGDDAKLRGLEDLLRAYGIKETVRTGKVALSRSSRD